ncbi:MAG TPA: Na-translocating system protein MpsC family protein [Gaiellaceae bacterium]
MSSDLGQDRHTAQAISNAITKLQHDHYGRGPETVRTVIGYDHVITLLENTFMPVERTLREAGEFHAVRTTRLAFQRAMEDRFVTTVEEITGRKVRAFLSQVSLDPDIAAEVFVLEHGGDDAPEGLG